MDLEEYAGLISQRLSELGARMQEIDHELGKGLVLIVRFHGVDATDHHDELGLEPEFTNSCDECVFFIGLGRAKR